MKTALRIYHWIPRILSVLIILLISMFAFDSFAPELTLWQQISGFLAHLIPSLFLLLLLILAWKREYVGGVVYIIVGIGMSPVVFNFNYSVNHSVSMSLGIIMLITFPLIVTGILFIISYFKKKNQTTTNN